MSDIGQHIQPKNKEIANELVAIEHHRYEERKGTSEMIKRTIKRCLYHALRAIYDIAYRAYPTQNDSTKLVNCRISRLLHDIDRYYNILEVAEYVALIGGKKEPTLYRDYMK